MVTSNSMVKHSRLHLIAIFLLWKGLLHILSAFCPGPGYDTSALILVDPGIDRHDNFSVSGWSDRLALNLFRWDSLYFIKAAERGKVHEQEWAFSWAYSRLLDFVVQLDHNDGSRPQTLQYLVAAIVISNTCHLLSVLVLYQLLLLTAGPRQRQQVAFIGATLHVMTPASMFLSSPYAEAPFSLLNLAGMLLYAQSRTMAQARRASLGEDAYKLGSGIMFGLATLMRSNGLLSGLVFLCDVARYFPQVFSKRLSVHDAKRLIITCMAGSIIAFAFVGPQYIAYVEYCTGERKWDAPTWCKRTIPSVYSWVQSRYWNIGMFRYWTIPNAPLFVMAAPMLWLLFVSSVTTLRSYLQPQLHGRTVPQYGVTTNPPGGTFFVHHIPELALPQLVLSIAAITSFHVQIVNRIASGYPTWYMMVATWLVDDSSRLNKTPQKPSRWIVRGMLTYAIAQGMLFANFLPPA
ncbi:ER membrane glycoprotein subunit of the GPI transamidase complex-like protein [Pleosporales sp. CAS-2024a]